VREVRSDLGWALRAGALQSGEWKDKGTSDFTVPAPGGTIPGVCSMLLAVFVNI
jgi:hypothetical protein